MDVFQSGEMLSMTGWKCWAYSD